MLSIVGIPAYCFRQMRRHFCGAQCYVERSRRYVGVKRIIYVFHPFVPDLFLFRTVECLCAPLVIRKVYMIGGIILKQGGILASN